MVIKRSFCLFFFVACFIVPDVFATPISLRISSDTEVVNIADGSAGDANPFGGIVTFSGNLGNWDLSVTGTSHPTDNINPGLPTVWNVNVRAQYLGSGSLANNSDLYINLSESGLFPGLYYYSNLGKWDLELPGISSWILYSENKNYDKQYLMIWDFGSSGSDATFGPKGVYAAGYWIEPENIFSLTSEFKISPTQQGSVFLFDFLLWGQNTSSVPEPSSLSLICLSMLGIGFAKRNKLLA